MDEVFLQGSLVSTEVPLQWREQGAEQQHRGFALSVEHREVLLAGQSNLPSHSSTAGRGSRG